MPATLYFTSAYAHPLTCSRSHKAIRAAVSICKHIYNVKNVNVLKMTYYNIYRASQTITYLHDGTAVSSVVSLQEGHRCDLWPLDNL